MLLFLPPAGLQYAGRLPKQVDSGWGWKNTCVWQMRPGVLGGLGAVQVVARGLPPPHDALFTVSSAESRRLLPSSDLDTGVPLLQVVETGASQVLWGCVHQPC